MKHSLVRRYIDSQAWLITPEGLELVAAVADRDLDRIEAVQKEWGEPLQGTSNVQLRGDIAVIPVTGPLFRYANLLVQMSGATSYEMLAKDIAVAMEDSAIAQVVLAMDTPGGAMDGVTEVADLIASYRGRKPITTYVGGQCCSAGLWIASATDRIICADTARVGCVGAVATMRRENEEGVEELAIVSSQTPRKALSPFDEDAAVAAQARADIQAMVDRLAEVFIGAVAEHRGMTASRVQATEGRVYVGSDAVAVGFADEVSTLERVISAAAKPRPATTMLAAAESQETDMDDKITPTIDLAYLQANHADLVAGLRAEGAETERQRILGIMEMECSVDFAELNDLRLEAARDPNMTAAQLSLKVVGHPALRAAMQREQSLLALQQDEAVIADLGAEAPLEEEVDVQASFVQRMVDRVSAEQLSRANPLN